MDRDIVLETCQRSGLTPKRLFLLAHKEVRTEADYFHREWLIYDNVSPQMERWIFNYNNPGRKHVS